MIPFVCVVTIDSPTFQSTTRFPTVAVPPVLLITDGVIVCADATCAMLKVRMVKKRGNRDVKKREEKGREGKQLRLTVFIINYSFTIAIVQNYQQIQISIYPLYSI
jgi:hypothetical protein